jgi:hypothetical protein
MPVLSEGTRDHQRGPDHPQKELGAWQMGWTLPWSKTAEEPQLLRLLLMMSNAMAVPRLSVT